MKCNPAVAACILASAAVTPSAAIQAAGDPEAGRVKSETCLGCHGIPTYHNTYPTYHVPKLSGQHAEYLIAALQAYKQGLRRHATMQIQAESLSEQDIADIAAFWAQAGK